MITATPMQKIIDKYYLPTERPTRDMLTEIGYGQAIATKHTSNWMVLGLVILVLAFLNKKA